MELDRVTRKISALAMMAAIVFVTGCGGEYRSVYGKVTVDGKPLETGRIRFHPVEGRPSSGKIGNDGSYTLTTLNPGDGAKPGEYAVTIEALDVQTSGERPKSLEEEMAGVGASNRTQIKPLISLKYANRNASGLTATVEDSGQNEVNFDLTK